MVELDCMVVHTRGGLDVTTSDELSSRTVTEGSSGSTIQYEGMPAAP